MKKILLIASVLTLSTGALADKGAVHLKGCPDAGKLTGDIFSEEYRAYNEHDGARITAFSKGSLRPGGTLTLHCKKGKHSNSCQVRSEDDKVGYTRKIPHDNWVKIIWTTGTSTPHPDPYLYESEPSCD